MQTHRGTFLMKFGCRRDQIAFNPRQLSQDMAISGRKTLDLQFFVPMSAGFVATGWVIGHQREATARSGDG